MAKTLLSLFFALLSTAPSAHAVVGGHDLTAQESSGLRALVPVKIGGELGQSQGMTVHIGDGILLTAWHVVHGVGNAATIRFFDVNQHDLGILRADKYKTDSPTAVLHLNALNMQIPIPDLAVIIPDESVRAKIRRLPYLKIHDDPATVKLDQLYAVGWGLESFDETGRYGIMKFGRVQLTASTGNTLTSTWKPGGEIIALRGGDSGTPLLQKIGEDEYNVVAITSLGTSAAAFKTNGFANNYFSRLDSAAVKEWLASYLLPAKGVSDQCEPDLIPRPPEHK